MNVLVLGAGGFIGSAIALGLLEDGHSVTGLGRDLARGQRILPALNWIKGDLRAMQRPADWLGLLDGIDVVINSAGTLQTGLRDNVDAVQHGSMLALYEAARASSIRQVIQISAAGADHAGQSGFMTSKSAADAALAQSGLQYCILRPGLVIGRNCFGGSELLRTAAAMPGLEIVPQGTGTVQCIAMSDVVAAVRMAIADPESASGVHDLVEAEAHSLGDVIACHREWLGFAPAGLRVSIPLALVRLASIGADALGWLGWRSPLRSNSIAALVHGVKGEAQQARKLLEHEPLSLAQTLSSIGPSGKADRWHARVALIYPLALTALIALWLVSGIVGLARTDAAAQIVIDGGMGPQLARAFVLGGSIADILIAFGLLCRPWLGKALTASLFLSLAYIGGSLIWSASLWLDPLGPMLKVIPILALTAMCLAMSEER